MTRDEIKNFLVYPTEIAFELKIVALELFDENEKLRADNVELRDEVWRHECYRDDVYVPHVKKLETENEKLKEENKRLEKTMRTIAKYAYRTVINKLDMHLMKYLIEALEREAEKPDEALKASEVEDERD